MKQHTHSILAMSIAIALTQSGVAIAEDQTTQATDSSMESITVLAQTYRNTATKTSLNPEETPQVINVIDSELLEERGVKSLNQALRYTPGVTTEQKGSSVTMYDGYNIRGFAVSETYYDGLILPFLSGWNLQAQIDPFALEQIEVFKGPTSALYGGIPPGGMVNMIAKSPQIESNHEIGLSLGSRDLTETSIDSTGQIGNSDFNYRFIASTRKKNSQVDGAEEERYVIAPSIDWNISENTLLNINMYYQNDPEMGINSALPVIEGTNQNTSAGDINWSKFEREFILAGYKFEHEFNEKWTFLQNFRYMQAELYQQNTYHSASGYDSTTGDLERYIYSTEENSESISFDNQMMLELQTNQFEHNILLGIDYQKLDGDATYNTYGATSVFGTFNIFSPDNDMINVNLLSAASSTLYEVSSEQLGLYAQDQIRSGNWILIAGGRVDRYESLNNDQENSLTYRIGGLYEFDNGLAPFASYSTSYEPTEGYDPQYGKQIEVGMKYMAPDRMLSGSVSLFNIIKSDVLTADPTDSTYQTKVQLGEVTSQGLEAEGKWSLTDAIDIIASYTYMDVEVTKDTQYQGTTPIYNPEHTANLWANYSVYEGAFAGSKAAVGIRHVGEMQVDQANTSGMVPDYTILDLSFGYDLSYLSSSLEGLTTNLIVNNALDTESYVCYDSTNCWYGVERTIELDVNYTF